jgi:hypothetical protein
MKPKKKRKTIRKRNMKKRFKMREMVTYDIMEGE